jgi:aminomethyltransferase
VTDSTVTDATTPALKRTALYDLIVEAKARMVPFAGWEMPVQFSGLVQEHQAVRSAVGLFDISHMGKFVLRGGNPLADLDRLVPSDLSGLQPGLAQYSVLLNEQGGIIDDLIIYNQGDRPEATVVLIVNASTCQGDRDWIASHLSPEVSLDDLSDSHLLLALQGPKAMALLKDFCEADLSDLPRFGHVETGLKLAGEQTGAQAGAGATAFIARTGYTGEDGVEIMVPIEAGRQLWQALLAAGATPCGLGARDTLRLEAAMALYGQDIDGTTTPLEAGLGWLVHLDRSGEFVGRSVLESQKLLGLPRRLVGIQMEGRNIARHGYPIVQEGAVVGEVTSGTWSPTLERAIALAYVPPELAKIGQAITVKIRDKDCVGTVVKRPFYRAGGDV